MKLQSNALMRNLQFNRWILAAMIIFLFGSYSLSAQIVIAGKVVDGHTGLPLVGASISVEDAATGMASTSGGSFRLEVPTDSSTVIFAFLGYEDKRVALDTVTDPSLLIVEMLPSLERLLKYEIVVRASPIVDLAAPVMEIPQSHLYRDAAVAVTPVLNRLTGIFMQSGALNTNRITIRGVGNRSPFGTAKIRAYLDDIPLTTGAGETTIEDIDLSILGAVKIWKGPAASTYGAGLGGLIQLLTDEPDSDDNNSLYLSNLGGSFGLLRNVVSVGLKDQDKRLNLKLNYNNTHSGGFRENNQYDRQSFTAIGSVKSVDDKNRLTLLTNFIDLKAFIPSSLNRQDFEQRPEIAAANWARVKGFEDYTKLLIGASNVNQFTETFANTTSLFATIRNAYESRPFNILRENNLALGARTKFDLRTVEEHVPDITVGAEFFNEDYRWQTNETNEGTIAELLTDNHETRRYYNIFAEFRYVLSSRFTISGGANFNNTSYFLVDRFLTDGDISGNYQFDNILSPRIGIKYALSDHASVYGIVSHGFSPPSLEETLNPDGSLNPDIQPERGWNFEVGTRSRSTGQKFQWDASVYSMRIEDLLVARRTALDQYIGINAGRTVHNGIEVFLQGVDLFAIENFGAYLSYTYADFKFDEFQDDDEDFSGNDLTGTAPHLLRLGLDYTPVRGIYAHLTYQFVDAMPLRDDNAVYSDAYQLVAIRAGYKFDWQRRWSFDLYVGFDNLFDEQYASMFLINAVGFGGSAPRYYYPGQPRNHYFGVDLNYLW